MGKKLILLLAVLLALCVGAAGEDAPLLVDRINHPETAFSFAPEAELLEIVFPQELNVDSAVIRCGGQVMLIDCASRAMAQRMVNLLEQLGVTEVDFVAISHPHYDHIDGLEQIAQAVKIPILGMGGVGRGEDAAQLMLAGATAVAVGTAMFADPFAPIKVRDELADIASRQGLERVAQLTGGVQPW